MALLTTYTNANKVTLRAEYESQIRTLVWINGYGNAWQVETVTRESYEYVGLTAAAALTCQAALVSAYTVARNIPVLTDGDIAYEEENVLIAEVVASPMEGSMWKVSVDKNDRVITIVPLETA